MPRRSIAQGCSEYNITVLIDQKDAERALRAVHGRFYLATLPLAVGLVGPGLIGSTLLTQIHQQHAVRCSVAMLGSCRMESCVPVLAVGLLRTRQGTILFLQILW